MKIINLYEPEKIVEINYFGLKLKVDKKYKYIYMQNVDSRDFAVIIVSTKKPYPNLRRERWMSFRDENAAICRVHWDLIADVTLNNINWKHTLRRINQLYPSSPKFTNKVEIIRLYNPSEYKEVNYFGQTFYINSTHQYIAVSNDSGVRSLIHSFKQKPQYCGFEDGWYLSKYEDGEGECLAEIQLNSIKPKDSLLYVL